MYVYKFVKIFIFLHKLWKLRIICIDTECLFGHICVGVWYEELACDIWHLYHNPNQFYSSFCVWINYANLVLICIIDISFVHDKALLDSQNNHSNCHKNLMFVYEFIQIFMILHKLCKLVLICIIDISFIHDKALLNSQNNHSNCHKNLRFVYEFIEIFMILHKLCKLGHICIGTACLFG